MPISTAANLKDAPGSVSHGYSWVPPGLNRKKVKFTDDSGEKFNFYCEISQLLI